LWLADVLLSLKPLLVSTATARLTASRKSQFPLLPLVVEALHPAAVDADTLALVGESSRYHPSMPNPADARRISYSAGRGQGPGIATELRSWPNAGPTRPLRAWDPETRGGSGGAGREG